VVIKHGRAGLFMFRRNHDIVSRSLSLYGEWCEPIADAFRGIVRPGDTAIDVGANLGVFTVLMARLVGKNGRVLSFEPLRTTAQLLAGNVALNALDNVRVFHAAVSDSDAVGSTASIPMIDNNAFQFSVLHTKVNVWDEPMQKVPITSIDTVLGQDCVNFIKVDAEGMDDRVLRGASGVILRCHPVLFFEESFTGSGDERHADTRSRDGVVHWLSQNGYQLFMHEFRERWGAVSKVGDCALSGLLRITAWTSWRPTSSPYHQIASNSHKQ